MVAKRTLADPVSNPGGYDPGQWATDARAEDEGLWNAVINQVGSIGGSANVITGVCSPVLIGSYVNGMTFRFTPTAPNTTVVSVNWDGKGAVALRQPDGTALAANDIVSGQPIECWYDSVAGYMRMSDWSEQSIAANALAAVSGNLLWTLIGDTTVSSAVAQIEHTFTASAYLEIHSIFSDLASASATLINVTLRNSGGAIVTCTHDGAVGINHIAAATGINRFYCGIIAATKYYNAEFSSVVENSSPGTGTQAPAQAVGSNATAADRVRVAFNSGNITAGRVTTYGLKA